MLKLFLRDTQNRPESSRKAFGINGRGVVWSTRSRKSYLEVLPANLPGVVLGSPIGVLPESRGVERLGRIFPENAKKRVATQVSMTSFCNQIERNNVFADGRG